MLLPTRAGTTARSEDNFKFIGADAAGLKVLAVCAEHGGAPGAEGDSNITSVMIFLMNFLFFQIMNLFM